MCNLQEYLKRLTPARDRRLKMRVTPTSPVYVMFDDTGGSVVNVTETGMAISIAVGNLPAVGDYPIRIRLQLPMSSQNVEVSARIVWLGESKKVVGVRLVDCTADARSRVSNWIASEKLATEFEQPAQLLAHNRQPLEIGASSNPSARDEETAAHYAEVFPAEKNYAKRLTQVDENTPQQDPFPAPVRSHTGPDDLILRAASKISTASVPRILSSPQVQTTSDRVAPSASNAPIAGFGSQSPTDEVKSPADGAVDSASPYIFDLSGLHVAALVFLFAVVGLIIGIVATKASVDVLASLGRGPFGKHARLHSQSRNTEPPIGLRSDSAPSVFPTETSSAQTSRSSVDLDSSIGADRVGSFRPLKEKAKGRALDSEPGGTVHARDSNSSISTTIEHEPSADSERHANRNDLKRLIARSMPPQATAEHAHSIVAVGPIRSARINRAVLIAKPATSTAPKPSLLAASPKRSHLAEAVGPKGTGPGNPTSDSGKSAAAAASPPPASPKPKNAAIARSSLGAAPRNPAPPPAKPAAPTAPNPRPPANSELAPPLTAPRTPATSTAKPNAPTAPSPRPSASSELAPPVTAPRTPAPSTAKPNAPRAPNPQPPADSELALPVTAEGSSNAVPRNPVPPTAAQPNPSAPAYTVPSKGSKLLKLVFPQKQVAFSSSLMITTQLSVLVPPESGLVAAQSSRLQAGKLVSYVLPRNPRPGDQYGAEETVKVHATIGQQGLVTDIKPVSGPIFLLSSTMGAVHLWRYKPTLLNGMPIETHQDVTVIFKLPR
jgi:Gram-negative bacterial TonB protein C-terminal